MKTFLTGIKPTGQPHLGNLFGMFMPALELAKEPDTLSAYFIADYHALTTIRSKQDMQTMTHECAATWLALGLDPEKMILYRQSDVPEIFELAWILSCHTPKSLMNNSHAYKTAQKHGTDEGINVGLFTYPILMAADILIADADLVPVGQDQIQHIEIAQDIAQRFNYAYGESLKIPKAYIRDEGAIIPGLDGQKMSKSYNNTIPCFLPSKKLRKLVNQIKSDSSAPDDPKNPDESNIFKIHKALLNENEANELAERYREGISWGEAKDALYQKLEAQLAESREKYESLMSRPNDIHEILAEGAGKIRKIAEVVLSRVREKIL